LRLFFGSNFNMFTAMNNLEVNTLMKNGKILVMDDEEDLRYIFTKMLNRLYYEVEVAGDGNEAIELFKRCSLQAI
jgi:CheY-like chemotaxis protein